jgi:FkbM family methyltransferase
MLRKWFQTQLDSVMTRSQIEQNTHTIEDLEREQHQKEQKIREAIIALDPEKSIFKRTHYLLRQYGLKFTLECVFRNLGIDVDSTIKYPIKGLKVRIGQHAPAWKLRLETDKWDELPCLKFLSDVIKEGDTILDVGAHYGMYTLFFAKLTQGQVYAFEPDLKAAHTLCNNVEKNSLTNVHVEKTALNDVVGEFTLRCHEMGDTGASLLPNRYSNESDLKEITVKTNTIDKYCKENGVIPNGIKIDVEGAEASVITGALNVIKKYHPWILLEFHSGFMSEKDAQENWHMIIASAKKVVFLCGYSLRFHTFIQY